MPDFRMQQSFPIANVIDATQRKAQMEQEFKQKNTELLNSSLTEIGKIGQSLLDRKKRMAQAMLLSQQPEVKDMLLGETVTQGLNGPIRKSQTASGGVGEEPKQNVPEMSPNQMGLLLEGQDPISVMKAAFERKNKLNNPMIDQSITTVDAFGRPMFTTTRKAPKGSQLKVEGPQTPGRGSMPRSAGINPETGEAISYNPVTQQNEDRAGNPYTGRIIPTAEGSEEQRRGTLALTGINSIEKINTILDNNPAVLSEIKKIRLSPGRVYAQLASDDAKIFYGNLKEAISNELYLKTGATANEQEIEDKTVSYLAALNDSPKAFKARMEILSDHMRPFDQRRRIDDNTEPKQSEKSEIDKTKKKSDREAYIDGAMNKGYSQVEAEDLANKNGFK